MKNLITVLLVCISTFGMSQTKSINGKASLEEVKIQGMSVSVTVDSAEEIESTFKVKDIKEILGRVDDNEDVSFEIVCNRNVMSNGNTSHVSYKVDGNSNDINGFLKRVKKVRKAAINYYKTK